MLYSGVFYYYYYLSPQTRQSIQHTLYERLLVYINFYLITRDVRYRQESYIIYRFYFENKWYFMNSYNSYVSRFFLLNYFQNPAVKNFLHQKKIFVFVKAQAFKLSREFFFREDIIFHMCKCDETILQKIFSNIKKRVDFKRYSAIECKVSLIQILQTFQSISTHLKGFKTWSSHPQNKNNLDKFNVWTTSLHFLAEFDSVLIHMILLMLHLQVFLGLSSNQNRNICKFPAQSS